MPVTLTKGKDVFQNNEWQFGIQSYTCQIVKETKKLRFGKGIKTVYTDKKVYQNYQWRFRMQSHTCQVVKVQKVEIWKRYKNGLH